jgi:hypothetical protein
MPLTIEVRWEKDLFDWKPWKMPGGRFKRGHIGFGWLGLGVWVQWWRQRVPLSRVPAREENGR